jgi:hypothetical protein
MPKVDYQDGLPAIDKLFLEDKIILRFFYACIIVRARGLNA